jgi:hypothetical protein
MKALGQGALLCCGQLVIWAVLLWASAVEPAPYDGPPCPHDRCCRHGHYSPATCTPDCLLWRNRCPAWQATHGAGGGNVGTRI